MRSSGRIPKEIPILLIGSDLDGRVFSEQTKTVVLSLHGAGIVSRYKLSPEQELVLRWTEKNKEAEIRVVGHLGSNGDRHTYGVAFFDQALNFWEMSFPPVTAVEIQLGLLTLACISCRTVEHIDNASVEADVVATNGGVLRSCKHCGTVTLWKPAPKAAQPVVAPTPMPVPVSPARVPAFIPPASNGPSDHAQLSLFSPAPQRIAPPPPQPHEVPEPAPFQSKEVPGPTSNYASDTPDSFLSSASTSAASLYSQPQKSAHSTPQQSSPQISDAAQRSAYSGAFIEAQSPVATLPPPPANSAPAPVVSPSTPRANRRKHPRVKVNYSACVRHPDRGDDIVQCEDMSKGGLRFKSRMQYYVQSIIDVAVPYEKGQPAIFVPAQIVFVEELPEQRLIRYGVQYLHSAKPRTYA
jgi:hypothetical protein